MQLLLFADYHKNTRGIDMRGLGGNDPSVEAPRRKKSKTILLTQVRASRSSILTVPAKTTGLHWRDIEIHTCLPSAEPHTSPRRSPSRRAVSIKFPIGVCRSCPEGGRGRLHDEGKRSRGVGEGPPQDHGRGAIRKSSAGRNAGLGSHKGSHAH